MPETQKEGSNYITLKEAAKISGYSPDYLGQLIRKGKLAGKQVYLNVAWVTTEKALRSYLANNKVVGGRSDFGTMFRGKARRWFIEHGTGDAIIRIARRVVYVVIVFMVILCAFLAYAFVANALHAMKLL